MSLPRGFVIEPAHSEDLPGLAQVEQEAAQLFVAAGLPAELFAEPTARARLEEASARGFLWVVRERSDSTTDGAVVGFFVLEVEEGHLFLAELDVAPSHARRGLGTALLREALRVAKRAGFGRLFLTTYRDLPWNAPFYARHGFLVLGQTPPQAVVRRLKAEEELAVVPRVAMAFSF